MHFGCNHLFQEKFVLYFHGCNRYMYVWNLNSWKMHHHFVKFKVIMGWISIKWWHECAMMMMIHEMIKELKLPSNHMVITPSSQNHCYITAIILPLHCYNTIASTNNQTQVDEAKVRKHVHVWGSNWMCNWQCIDFLSSHAPSCML